MTAAAAPEKLREVLLIDLSGLFWSAYHATSSGPVSEATSITLAQVRRCIGDGDKLVAVCCDSGRSFRKELYPAYKANRPERDAAAYGELDKVKARLRRDGLLLWEADGFEADDIIATASAAAWGIGHPVLIASADKDLLQLVGDGVKALRTHSADWKVADAPDVVAKFGVRPAQLGDWLALVGDPGDNIPGAHGVGAKTATALLTKYETLANLYAALDRNEKVATPFVTESLKNHRAVVAQGRALIALRADAPITFEDIYAERKPQPLAKVERENMDDDGPNLSPGPGPAAPPEPAQQKTTDAIPPIQTPTDAPVPDMDAKPTNGNGHVETALAIYQPFERGLEPQTIGKAMVLAQSLYDSRLYERFKSAEAIHAVIIRGREMGLGALTALDVFHVIQGRPVPWAWFMIARAMEDPDCEYLYEVESSATSATWETKNRRNPKPQRLTYTFQEAQAAKLVVRDSAWEKNPSDMVTKTAGLKLARRVYPRAVIGLTAIEELGAD